MLTLWFACTIKYLRSNGSPICWCLGVRKYRRKNNSITGCINIEFTNLRVSHIRNAGGNESMSVNVKETNSINITCGRDMHPWTMTLWGHIYPPLIAFQKVNAVYRCMTCGWTMEAFCLAEGENDRDSCSVDTASCWHCFLSIYNGYWRF